MSAKDKKAISDVLARADLSYIELVSEVQNSGLVEMTETKARSAVKQPSFIEKYLDYILIVLGIALVGLLIVRKKRA